jgi:hypothetical protein
MQRRAFAVAGLAAACLPRGAQAEPAAAPLVLELYTSQGCSSCPPADALLGELATRPGLLPLGFHVTYWDRLGWRDPFSLEAATRRQQRYAATVFGSDQVYTPQLVVHGRRQAVGSDRRAVQAAIAAAEAERAARPAVPLVVSAHTDRVVVEIGAGEGLASLLLVGFDALRTTRVGAGENGGRRLTEVNIVRHMETIGAWRGVAQTIDVRRPEADRVAVLLQANDGRMLGAALLG